MIHAPSSVFAATVVGLAALVLPTPAPHPVSTPLPMVRTDAQRVSFKTADRQELVASFYEPRRKKGLAPGALLVHDRGGSREDLDVLAQRLSKQGFAVLVPDLRGHGESARGDVDWTTLDEQGRSSLWAFAARDIKAAAKHLTEVDGVHTANLSLLGLGAGSLLATRHAERDESVRGLALVEPMLVAPGEPSSPFYPSASDLESLGGLPTFIVISREAHESTKQLSEAAMESTGENGFIELMVSKAAKGELLSDKRVPMSIAKWLMEQASPKKGSDR